MARGTDVHPYYQRGLNFRAAQNIGFVWVKVSDGGSAYRMGGYVPDTLVAGAKSAGKPVGGYHYAQLSPSPETQADVLIGQIRRLGATGVAAMLDLEAPFSVAKEAKRIQARNFAISFLLRMKSAGFKPCIYMSSSFAKALRPDQWGISDLVIVIARYGAKPEARGPAQYLGRYDVHQYSSAGTLPGSAGAVDEDESYTDAHLGAYLASPPGGTPPPLTPHGDDVASIHTYDPCPTDNAGKTVLRHHTFVLPVGSVSQVTKNAWLSFKCMDAPGGAEYVRLQSIRGDDTAGLPGGQYPVTKEWKGVAADRTRVYIQAADGADQFVAYIQCNRPYSLCIEVQPK